MAFFYVKTGGLATGDDGRETVARTGSYATMTTANYYSDLIDVLATPSTSVAAGDSIYISDASDSAYSADADYSFPTSGAYVKVISCSDTAVETYAEGAEESSSGAAYDMDIIGRAAFYGMVFNPNDNLEISGHVMFNGGAITLSTSGNVISVTTAGAQLVNTDINGVGNHRSGFDNAVFDMVGGAITSSGTWTSFTNSSTADGGGIRFIWEGVDASALTTYITEGISATDVDIVDIQLYGCKINAGLTSFNAGGFFSPQQKFIAMNCGSGAEAAYQFFQETWNGIVDDDTAVVRSESTAFLDGTKVAILAQPNSEVSLATPLIFELPARFAALSSASTDTIRIYLASATSDLTDNEVWAELIYPDGTNEEDYNIVSSAAGNAGINNFSIDPLDSGTALTADTVSTWTSGTKYQIDLDTSGNVGGDCAPIIKIYVARDVDISFDTEVGVVA